MDNHPVSKVGRDPVSQEVHPSWLEWIVWYEIVEGENSTIAQHPRQKQIPCKAEHPAKSSVNHFIMIERLYKVQVHSLNLRSVPKQPASAEIGTGRVIKDHASIFQG